MDGAPYASAADPIHKLNKFGQTRFKLAMHFRDNLLQSFSRVNDVTMKPVKQLSVYTFI